MRELVRYRISKERKGERKKERESESDRERKRASKEQRETKRREREREKEREKERDTKGQKMESAYSNAPPCPRNTAQTQWAAFFVPQSCVAQCIPHGNTSTLTSN